MNIDHYENIERQRQQLQERAHDLAFELYSVHYLHSDPSGDWLRPWVIEYFPGGSRYEFETYEQALKWIEEEIPKRHSDFEEADEVEGQGKDDEARPLTCEEKKQEIDRLYDLAEALGVDRPRTHHRAWFDTGNVRLHGMRVVGERVTLLFPHLGRQWSFFATEKGLLEARRWLAKRTIEEAEKREAVEVARAEVTRALTGSNNGGA